MVSLVNELPMPSSRPATGSRAMGSIKLRPTRCSTPKILSFILPFSFSQIISSKFIHTQSRALWRTRIYDKTLPLLFSGAGSFSEDRPGGGEPRREALGRGWKPRFVSEEKASCTSVRTEPLHFPIRMRFRWMVRNTSSSSERVLSQVFLTYSAMQQAHL